MSGGFTLLRIKPAVILYVRDCYVIQLSCLYKPGNFWQDICYGNSPNEGYPHPGLSPYAARPTPSWIYTVGIVRPPGLGPLLPSPGAGPPPGGQLGGGLSSRKRAQIRTQP